MNALVERWPRLQRIPRVELTSLPTPVHALPQLSDKVDADVWVKRDDLTAARYGGNKVRKLEYVLGRAQECVAETLITVGALGSHHVFATALYGREHGFETHAVVTPQPYHPHVEDQLRADAAVGARLIPAATYPQLAKEMVALAIRLRLWGQRPYFVPMGGSTVHGTLGYVNAAVELAAQIDAGLCPDPDAVYVACGSCGTAAGIALGLAAAGVKTRVVAVRVTDRFHASALKLSALIKKAQALVRDIEPRFPIVASRAIRSVELDDVEIGKGYGLPTPSSEAARELAAREGLSLDVAYTSKALACLLRDAEGERRGQRLLFWNTFSSAPMQPFLQHAPEVPEELVKLMTLHA